MQMLFLVFFKPLTEAPWDALEKGFSIVGSTSRPPRMNDIGKYI
jgi:hypothetical protein